MNTYIVTFEISDFTRKTQLKASLRSAYSYYCPIHENALAIKTEKKASEVRDEIIKLLAPTDRAFVIRSGTESAWYNSYGEKNSEWLKKNL